MTREQVEVATRVSRQAADLLGERVFVVDERERVVAASEPGFAGRVLKGAASRPYAPLRFDAWEGRVIVGSEVMGSEVAGSNGAGSQLAAQNGSAQSGAHPRLVRGVLELIIGQMTLEGLRGRDLQNTLVHDLLRGHVSDEESIYRQARILGMDLAPPRAVLLIGAEAYLSAGGAARADDIIGSVVRFFHLPSDTICAYIGAGEVAVLKASDAKNLAPWAQANNEDDKGDRASDKVATWADSWADLGALKRAAAALVERLAADTGARVSVGVGRYHRGLAGLAHSYADAKAALSLGRRLGQHDVHCLDSVGIAAFIGVADERTKADLATYLLSPLDNEPELLRTLACLFEHNCQPTAAAKALGVHRNTLSYRLEKVALLTGMDPRCFDDAVQIRLALVMRQLHKGAADGPAERAARARAVPC